MADQYLRGPDVLKRYGIHETTLWRWLRDPDLAYVGFPRPLRIRGRRYWLLHELEEWERGNAGGNKNARLPVQDNAILCDVETGEIIEKFP
jgi:predicted DNA-binding transcriptional regulator AlpA